MKTIYINGLMRERCGDFLNRLAGRFRVVGEGLRPLTQAPHLHFVDPGAGREKPAEAEVQEQARSVIRQTEELAAHLAADLKQAGLCPDAGWQVPAEVIRNDLLPRVNVLMRRERLFRDYHARHGVDLVISGSDYGGHSRPVALAARELGVPTLNLEHGFFFSRFQSWLIEDKAFLPTLFVSEYANLDNALEVAGFAREAEDYPHLGTRFLDLGTPVESVADQDLDRAAALQSLDLPDGRPRVLILGSWIEARAMNSLVQGQLDTMAAYEDLFRSLARHPRAGEVDLLIKLHPAEGHPQVFPGVQAALADLARQAGLPPPRVYKDNLPELLSVCDVVVTMGFSSVLFDAFQLDRPAVVLVLPFLAPSRQAGWQERISIPLRAGVMAAVETGEEVWSRVFAGLDPQERERLQQARAKLRERYGLEYRPVQEKSAAILAWIENLLDGNGA